MANVIVPPLQIREDALNLTMFLKEPTPETRLTAGRDYSIVVDGSRAEIERLRELINETIDRLEDEKNHTREDIYFWLLREPL